MKMKSGVGTVEGSAESDLGVCGPFTGIVWLPQGGEGEQSEKGKRVVWKDTSLNFSPFQHFLKVTSRTSKGYSCAAMTLEKRQSRILSRMLPLQQHCQKAA